MPFGPELMDITWGADLDPVRRVVTAARKKKGPSWKRQVALTAKKSVQGYMYGKAWGVYKHGDKGYYKSWLISKTTDAMLEKMAQWAKEGATTKELRQLAREGGSASGASAGPGTAKLPPEN